MEDAKGTRDWEALVLERLRERLEGERDALDDAAGWEAAALERLRAHFDDKPDGGR